MEQHMRAKNTRRFEISTHLADDPAKAHRHLFAGCLLPLRQFRIRIRRHRHGPPVRLAFCSLRGAHRTLCRVLPCGGSLLSPPLVDRRFAAPASTEYLHESSQPLAAGRAPAYSTRFRPARKLSSPARFRRSGHHCFGRTWLHGLHHGVGCRRPPPRPARN